ncbi:MAG: sulfotransferase domain-containing protein [Candidatus Acidiferrales bacterium]
MEAVSPLEFVKTAYHYVAGKSVAGKNAIVFPDDTFLVSYQRSGNTWTRFLIANLIHLQDVSFSNVEQLIPDIYVCSQKFLLGVKRPRLLKSHQPFDPGYKKVIYIVRDPRDVALSMYHWQMKRRRIEDGYSIEQFITRFIAGEYEPGAGSWGQNVASWLAARGGTPGFLLLRYEDMMKHCIQELGRIANFLGLERSPAQMARAAELSSAERMRDLERRQSKVWKTTQNTRQDKAFVRSAKTGGWKDELPAVSVSEIENAWGALIRILGYELTINPSQQHSTDQQTLLRSLLVR